MKEILIADADPVVLKWFQGEAQESPADWRVTVADDAEKVRQLTVTRSFDAVLVNPAIPGLDSVQIFNRLMNSRPATARILLCNPGDEEAAVRLLGLVHQSAAKPGDGKKLCDIIGQALSLRTALANERIQRLVSGILSLPSMPELYLQLLEVLRKPDPPIDRIAGIVMRDIGMSTKILQLVNSAFMGLRQPVTSVGEAVLHLGVETIKNLVLSLQFFSMFERVKNKELNFSELWRHSWETGVRAKRLAQIETSNAALTEQAFAAGLLHDVGKLILAKNLPSEYQIATNIWKARKVPLWLAEKEVFQASHAEVGAYLLALWGLPDGLTEAVLHHHHPTGCPSASFGALAAVHVANALEHEPQRAAGDLTCAEIDPAYLAQIGLSDRLETWRAALAQTQEEV